MKQLFMTFILLFSTAIIGSEDKKLEFYPIKDYDWNGKELTIYYDFTCGKQNFVPQFDFSSCKYSVGTYYRCGSVNVSLKVIPNGVTKCLAALNYNAKKVIEIDQLTLKEAGKANINVIDPDVRYNFIFSTVEMRNDSNNQESLNMSERLKKRAFDDTIDDEKKDQ